jgi:HK97 gp10 family phage protein
MAKETFTVKTEGFKELHDLLLEMAKDIGYKKTARRVLVPAVKASMQPVLDMAKTLAPYDENNTTTPHLRDTLRLNARVPTDRDMRSMYIDQNDAVIGIVSVKTDKRGISQEFGNEQVSAQPYLRPAIESQSQRVIQNLGTFLTYKLQQYKSKKV